jgi:hypothetical protein
MAYCANCGITYPSDKRFCKDCGIALMEDPAPPPSPPVGAGPVRCASCGWTLPPSDRFCPQCGARVASSLAFEATIPGGAAPSVPTEAAMATEVTQRFTQQDFYTPTPPTNPSEGPAPLQETQAFSQQDLFAPSAPQASPQTTFQAGLPAMTPTFDPGQTVVDSPMASPPFSPPPGVSLPSAAITQTPMAPAPQRKSRVGVLVVIAIVLFGILIGGALMVQRVRAKRQAAQLAQETQAPAPVVPPPVVVQETPPQDEKLKDTLGRMNAVLTALENYRTARKKLPQSLQDLGSVMDDPLMRSDGWGNPLIYLVDLSNNTYVIRSIGPDGKKDTEDDIRVSDDSVASWREQHHELLDEWRVANLELFQKLSSEQITTDTKAALDRKKAEREKAKAEALAAQQAAQQLAAQRRLEEEKRKQQEAAQLAEQQRLQQEAQRRLDEERAKQQAEAQRKARQEKMNFVETFGAGLSRWSGASFEAVAEKGKPAMRISGFGLLKDATDWDNYTATFDVKIQKEGVNFIIRARDHQNFYFLKLTDDKAKEYPKNSLIKYLYVGGKYLSGPASNEAAGALDIVTLPFKIKRNDTYQVTISVSGSAIRTSINGQTVDTWQDNTFKQGAFGFNCSTVEQATVTSFQMRSN